MKNIFGFKNSYNFSEFVKIVVVILFISLPALVNAQQKVIQLYKGAAPGSENWTWDEKENNHNQFNMEVVYNISHPSLTIFLPDKSIANGTSVILCPGGAWHFLAIEKEYDLAHWLNTKGITAFVLKCRTVHVFTDDPVKEHITKYPNDPHSDRNNEENKPVIALAIEDGKAAMAYVRKHAADYGIAQDRIGIMGGSSGVSLAAAIAYNQTVEDRPDFVVPLYPHVRYIIPKKSLGINL